MPTVLSGQATTRLALFESRKLALSLHERRLVRQWQLPIAERAPSTTVPLSSDRCLPAAAPPRVINSSASSDAAGTRFLDATRGSYFGGGDAG